MERTDIEMADSTPAPRPVADLSYEQARDELVQLVSRIESGQVPLEEAMLLWERGEQLAAHCQAKLDAAQETLERTTASGASDHGDEDAVDETGADEDDADRA
ncbi:exodeoxyribonuclease VII small subunit [Ornithinimicrobium panacihumi]|uniref:exodeoxyribonuclease VII small subunit n=1 Tax=Ornithinimicrobium panacihumi TaxID=2008449 RepID=UPI003F8C0766